jgi:hypothetical protein
VAGGARHLRGGPLWPTEQRTPVCVVVRVAASDATVSSAVQPLLLRRLVDDALARNQYDRAAVAEQSILAAARVLVWYAHASVCTCALVLRRRGWDASTLSTAGTEAVRYLQIPYVIIDEAAQAVEPVGACGVGVCVGRG